uniref:Uncharacterized protein n=1 Tax=Siphoviridae sp. ctES717 TaxID=2827564 RepID=A0A8S5RRT9_9CAUD|nr:MAG TPA: hypothetical protein [Siphoviridae sp. ctES717]
MPQKQNTMYMEGLISALSFSRLYLLFRLVYLFYVLVLFQLVVRFFIFK